jgi:hypothetical protein
MPDVLYDRPAVEATDAVGFLLHGLPSAVLTDGPPPSLTIGAPLQELLTEERLFLLFYHTGIKIFAAEIIGISISMCKSQLPRFGPLVRRMELDRVHLPY